MLVDPEILDLCDQRRDLKKKRGKQEEAKDYRDTKRKIRTEMKMAKETGGLSPLVFLYWPFQGGTSVVVPYCSCCLCLYFGSAIMLVTYFVNFR